MALNAAERAELDALRDSGNATAGDVASLQNWRRRHSAHAHNRHVATNARIDGTNALVGEVITWGEGVDEWGADMQDALDLAQRRIVQTRDMAATAIDNGNAAHQRINDATDPSHTWLLGAWVAAGWTVLALLASWGASRLSNGQNQLGDHPQFGTIMIGAWLLGLALIAGITVLIATNRAGRLTAQQPAPNPVHVAQQPAPNPAPPTPALGTPAVPAPPAPPAPQPAPVHAGP